MYMYMHLSEIGVFLQVALTVANYLNYESVPFRDQKNATKREAHWKKKGPAQGFLMEDFKTFAEVQYTPDETTVKGENAIRRTPL